MYTDHEHLSTEKTPLPNFCIIPNIAEIITSRERPKSASYLRLKNIQGTTIGNIWKNVFFQKKVFGKKSRILPKNPKRDPLGSIKVFLQTEKFKKIKGVPFDEIQIFRKNVA